MEKKKEKKMTLAEIKGTVGYLDRDGIGYRKTRATAVLAMHAQCVQQKQDEVLAGALAQLRSNNFDLQRLKRKHLEIIYASFDKKLTMQIVDEFEFVPTFGNIRDLGKAEGHCDLCGKGDSRDDGANEDKLRYQFLLTNHAGGQSIWVGSSCIVQHGLHVDGAANAEEAEQILKKSLAEHLKAWKIAQWRDDNPDHGAIPELWSAFSRIPYFRQYPDEFYAAYGAEQASVPHTKVKRLFRPMRSASKFYDRKGFLSPSKTEVWREAQKVRIEINKMLDLFRDAANKFPPKTDPARYWVRDWSEAVAYIDQTIIAQREEAEREAKAAARARAARRKPKKAA